MTPIVLTEAEKEAIQDAIDSLYEEGYRATPEALEKLLARAGAEQESSNEHAAVVAERDALKVRNGKLERLLLVAGCPANCIDGAYHGHDGEPVQCQFCYERSTALTPSPQSDQEEA